MANRLGTGCSYWRLQDDTDSTTSFGLLLLVIEDIMKQMCMGISSKSRTSYVFGGRIQIASTKVVAMVMLNTWAK